MPGVDTEGERWKIDGMCGAEWRLRRGGVVSWILISLFAEGGDIIASDQELGQEKKVLRLTNLGSLGLLADWEVAVEQG